MKTKELTITAIFVAVIIVQSFALFNFPITLTYTIFYYLTKKLEDKKLPFLAVVVFVVVKNIILPALVTTIIFDIVGLLFFIAICLIPNKYIVYPLIPVVIIIHILLLDLSTILLTVNVLTNIKELFALWGTQIALGFITYIYAPLSIILILMLDGIDYLTEIDLND